MSRRNDFKGYDAMKSNTETDYQTIQGRIEHLNINDTSSTSGNE